MKVRQPMMLLASLLTALSQTPLPARAAGDQLSIIYTIDTGTALATCG